MPPINSIETFRRVLAAIDCRVRLSPPELKLLTAMRSGNWSIRSCLRLSIEPCFVSATIFSIIPGGRLIIQDSFLHDREVLYLEEVRLFALSMLLVTPA